MTKKVGVPATLLNEVSRIQLGFPHDFDGRVVAYGNTFGLIDHHRGDVYTELDGSPPPPRRPRTRSPHAPDQAILNGCASFAVVDSLGLGV